MKSFAASVLFAALTLGPVVQADERPNHFEGQPAESLQQALENLSEYNARLTAVLENDELAPADHDEIHQLTYTLENALKRIAEDVDRIAAKLESIHVASEERDSATIRVEAPDYLSAAGNLTAR